MRGLNKNRAFTLVELMVVITIFAVIGGGIASCFVSGMKLWHRASTVDFSRFDLIFTLEGISKELRQSADIPAIGFEGEAEKFSFPAVSGDSVIKVTYYFEPFSKSVMCRQAKLKDVLEEKINETYSEKKAAQADSFSVSYFFFDKEENKYVWVNAWEKEKGKFIGIKLNAKLKGEEFVRTVFLPISS